MLGAVELGRDLDGIRLKLRRRCRRVKGLRGQDTADRIIDMVLAPLLLDADDETVLAVGDDLRLIFSTPPQQPLPVRG